MVPVRSLRGREAREGQLFQRPQIQFARAENRKGLDLDEIALRRHEQIGQARRAELFQEIGNLGLVIDMDHGQGFSFPLIGNAGDGKELGVAAGGQVQGLLHASVRNHFAPDLGEAREAVGDA